MRGLRTDCLTRVGDWKLLKGSNYGGEWSGRYGPAGREDGHYSLDMVRQSQAARTLDNLGLPIPEDKVILKLREQADVKCKYSKDSNPCDPSLTVCLFKITEDPCEQNNLILDYPNIVKVRPTEDCSVLTGSHY